MGAKETVVNIRKSVELPNDHSLLSMLDFTDKVAEVSFEAGQREAQDWIWDKVMGAKKSGFDEGKSEGRMEVVGEIGYYSQTLTLKELQETVQWQAQLEEWGITPNKKGNDN